MPGITIPGGNATVPTDAPFLPPQVFVNAANDIFERLGTAQLDWQVLTIGAVSSVNNTKMEQLALFLSAASWPCNVSFAGSNIQDVDGLLTAFGNHAPSLAGKTLDITGGTIPIPTPKTVEEIVIKFNDTPISTGNNFEMNNNSSDGNQFIFLDVTKTLAQSVYESQTYKLGILDSPTGVQQATKYLASLATHQWSNSMTFTRSTDTVTIRDLQGKNYPYTINENTSGITLTSETPGDVNQAIQDIVSAGGTVLTN